jgi:hypothetical protein
VTVIVGGAASVAAPHSVSREPGEPWSCTWELRTLDL